VQQAKERFTVTGWVQAIVSGAGIIQPLLEDVLGRLPVVGAGFQAVSLFISTASALRDALVDGMYVTEVINDVRVVARHAVAQMMQTANMRPDDCEIFLRKLTLVMGSVENASTTLDRYLASSLAANAAKGSQLGPLMGKLRAVGGELVSLKFFRTTLETHKVVHKLLTLWKQYEHTTVTPRTRQSLRQLSTPLQFLEESAQTLALTRMET
jgi:hypothetical protein